jgi:hypothetical protein
MRGNHLLALALTYQRGMSSVLMALALLTLISIPGTFFLPFPVLLDLRRPHTSLQVFLPLIRKVVHHLLPVSVQHHCQYPVNAADRLRIISRKW